MLVMFFSCKHWTLSQTLWHTSKIVSKHLRVVTVHATPCLFSYSNLFFFCLFNLFLIYFVYICSVLLYKSMVCTVVLLPHWWCAFSCVIGACAREGGVKTKPCASRDLTRLAIVFYNAKKNHKQQRTIKNVQNVPCEELTCHTIINTWHLSHLFLFFTLVR